MFGFRIILVLFIIFNRCFGRDTFEEAKKIAAENRLEDEEKYQHHNVTSNDYMYLMALEIFPPSEANRKSDIMLECQRLEKKHGRCRGRKFKHCLRKLGKKIPKEDKCQMPFDARCNYHEKYSNIGGFCNNLKHPLMGMAATPYKRLLKPVYEDDISELRLTIDGEELPNARILGNILDKASHFKCGNKKCGHHINNYAGIFFCQLLAHDISSRKVKTIKGNASNGIGCCHSSYKYPLPKRQTIPGCVAIDIPKDDCFYGDIGVRCQSFVRMQGTPDNDCEIKHSPENLVSSFLDLDPVYSTSDKEMYALLVNDTAFFNMGREKILPIQNGTICAGDFRFAQTPPLACMHSLFYNMHNLVVKHLKRLNPHWRTKKLLWESRRITIACYQHITYYEWLPLVLGDERCRSYGLICDGKYDNCGSYDSQVDPTTLHEFAHGGFRWFHAFIPSTIEIVNENYEVEEEIPLSDTYLNLDLIKEKFYGFLRGVMKQKQQMHQAGYTEELRNKFVKVLYNGKKAGADGFLLDVMRGRDGGIPPFIYFYSWCFSKKIKCWCDLKPYFEKEHYRILRKMYKNVEDIDFIVGTLLEKRKCPNEMGEIGGCIVLEQFYRFKYGDRFFYSHQDLPHSFTPEQLYEIKRMTFARLVCMSTKMERVPRKGFVSPSEENTYIDCCDIKPIDFEPFKEKC